MEQKITTSKRIYLDVIVWIVISAFAFLYFFPSLVNNLLALQDSHEAQITEINDLKAQVQSTHIMEEDLNAVKASSAEPSGLFTKDTQLVNEIQHIETIAHQTSTSEVFTISGTADKATALKGSASQIFQVPYSIKVTGSFANSINFLAYLENSYFISPVSGVNMVWDDSVKSLVTTVFGAFYIHK